MNYILFILAAVFVNNYILSQFLGICPFLGVSKKVETAAGMGVAVIFVMTIASAATYFIYKEELTGALSVSRCLSSTYNNKLCRSRCCRF